jgi:hypothetical protein
MCYTIWYIPPIIHAMSLVCRSWSGEITIIQGLRGWIEIAAWVYLAIMGRNWDGGRITAFLDGCQALWNEDRIEEGEVRREKCLVSADDSETQRFWWLDFDFDEDDPLPCGAKVQLYYQYEGQFRRWGNACPEKVGKER